MLTEVCNFVHNYFDRVIYSGNHEISNGVITDDDVILLVGQRFRIKGSALNDGIYTYHDDGICNDDDTEYISLNDETFNGAIIAMGVPKDFLTIVQQIADWIAQNSSALNSPYQSESFGGYSYTKAVGGGSRSGGTYGWQDMFRRRLSAYRKIA